MSITDQFLSSPRVSHARRLGAYAWTQVFLTISVFIASALLVPDQIRPVHGVLIGVSLTGSLALWKLRERTSAEWLLYGNLALFAVLLVVTEVISGQQAGTMWVLLQLVPVIATLLIHRARAAVIGSLIALLALASSALLTVTDRFGIVQMAPSELLWFGVGMQSVTLVFLTVSLVWFGTREQRAMMMELEQQLQRRYDVERRALSDALARQVVEDPLTGLSNRRGWETKLQERIENDAPFTVVLVDLDRFKMVNEGRGAGVGDEVLKHVADRLRRALPDAEDVARLGGDEFVILLADARLSAAMAAAEHLRLALRKPLRVAGLALVIESSLGIFVGDKDAPERGDALRWAEMAMYRAKSLGGSNIAVFSHDEFRKDVDRITIESELRRAIDEGELDVRYQPIIDVENRRVTSCEALVRWEHPERGTLTPAQFIPLAEQSPLIGQLDAWVLARVVEDARQWGTTVPSDFRVHINVSGREISSPRLIERITEGVKSLEGLPVLLAVEMTESVVIRDLSAAQELIRQLRVLGVEVAIDDFGAGHASLKYLRELPIDVLKLDGSFIEVLDEPAGAAITRNTIRMAHALGVRVVAEWVESEEQLATLSEMKCDLVQGRYFSRAVPADELPSRVRAGRDAA